MKATRFLAATTLCMLTSAAVAQEKGNWRPASNTARAVTGEIYFTETKLAINFAGFTVAQIRTLEPTEVSALFNAAADAEGSGNLYRTDIPGDKHFLHKNTLCGSEETQWVATFVSGKTLQLAFFSGPAMPKLTPEAVANTTTLCGTYAYTR